MTDTTAPVARTVVRGPLWRDVYVLAGMRGMSFAGDIVAETAITLRLQAEGAGSYAVMALLLAATMPPILLAPLTGAFADRFDSRRLVVSVALLQGLVCLAMTTVSSPGALIGLSVLLSVGLAFTHPVFGALPRVMVGKDNVPRAASISQITAMAGMVVAPGVGGVLTGAFGTTIPLVLDAASFGLVALGATMIVTRLHRRRAQTTTDPAEPAAGQAYRVRSDRFLLSVLLLSGVVMAGASIINVLIVFYVRETFAASAVTYGMIMSAWALGMVPGGMLVRRLKGVTHETMLVGSFVCIGVAILGTGLVPGVWWILPFYILGGIGNGAQATVTHILLNVRVPDTHRGRAFAALGAVSNTGPTLGFLFGGVIMSITVPRHGFLSAGVLVLIAVALLSGRVRRTASPSGTAPAPCA
jgi:MFS family permease